jgi:hypothetical protein
MVTQRKRLREEHKELDKLCKHKPQGIDSRSQCALRTCGKKKPDIQNTEGWPCCSQSRMNTMRAWKSFTQDARGFRDGYAAASQFLGTWLLSRHVYILQQGVTTKQWKQAMEASNGAEGHDVTSLRSHTT